MVPEFSSDSGSGSSALYGCQDGLEVSWLGLLLTLTSAIEVAGGTTTSSEGGEDSKSFTD
jgi:hypothetical protein